MECTCAHTPSVPLTFPSSVTCAHTLPWRPHVKEMSLIACHSPHSRPPPLALLKSRWCDKLRAVPLRQRGIHTCACTLTPTLSRFPSPVKCRWRSQFCAVFVPSQQANVLPHLRPTHPVQHPLPLSPSLSDAGVCAVGAPPRIGDEMHRVRFPHFCPTPRFHLLFPCQVQAVPPASRCQCALTPSRCHTTPALTSFPFNSGPLFPCSLSHSRQFECRRRHKLRAVCVPPRQGDFVCICALTPSFPLCPSPCFTQVVPRALLCQCAPTQLRQ